MHRLPTKSENKDLFFGFQFSFWTVLPHLFFVTEAPKIRAYVTVKPNTSANINLSKAIDLLDTAKYFLTRQLPIQCLKTFQ